MSKRRKRKIKLPTDRNGNPINVGDWLMFDDGPFHVQSLTTIGDGCWMSEAVDGTDSYSDNLGAGVLLDYESMRGK